MIIKRKRNNDIIINTKDEYINYINSIISNIKNYNKIPSIESLNKLFYSNENYYKKTFDILVKKHFYNLSFLNKKYWIDRGWTETESIEKINTIQLNNNQKNIEKQSILKNENYNEWSKSKTTNINYYLSKGYTLEDSKKMLKERQTTFTLEKCIKKYGEIKGYEEWEKRQRKWINTLSKINFNTDSHSINYILQKYGDNWIKIALDRYDYSENILFFIKYTIENKLNIKEFLKYVDENSDLISITDYSPFFKSKILQEYYNVTFDEFKVEFLKTNKSIITNYGVIRYYDNHITRSNGEYEITKFLVKNNINYKYEQKYPNSKLICDFYLIDKDLYIEYTGFLKSDFFIKINTKIVEKYLLRFEKKCCFCQENNLNLYYNSDVKIIINKIKTIYGIK